MLFDICSCKCADIYRCTCPKDCKVPAIDKPFLVDQRSFRMMSISRVDSVESKLLEKLKKRYIGMKPCC